MKDYASLQNTIDSELEAIDEDGKWPAECPTCEGTGQEVDGVICHVCSGTGRQG